MILELSGSSAAGQGVSTDIIEAAALAYVRALSNVERKVRHGGRGGREPRQPVSSPGRRNVTARERSTPSLVQ